VVAPSVVAMRVTIDQTPIRATEADPRTDAEEQRGGCGDVPATDSATASDRLEVPSRDEMWSRWA
jgi:hypothetical protein